MPALTAIKLEAAQADVPPPLLSLRDVTLVYPGDRLVTAIRNVTLDVARSERLVLLGPSGCGKSSLLKAIGGFIEPYSGEILLGGKAVRAPGPDRMMVFQEFDQLLPWKTVLGNVMFPMAARGRVTRAAARGRAHEMLKRVGLGAFADAYPHTLSGGMKQRVAIARALALEPEILLMDEPFGALDALTRRQMQDELLGLWEELRFTLVFVTHGIDEAIMVGSRVIVLASHPGTVRAEIDVTKFDHSNRADPSFGTTAKALEALLLNQDGDGI